MKQEKRIQTRTNYSAHVLVNSGSGKTLKGVIRDISLDSIYLYIEPNFEVGLPVMVEIILFGTNSQLTIKMLARVTRQDQDGVVMNFITPLEWWPIFTYFSTYDLDKVKSSQENENALESSNARSNPAAFQGDLTAINIENLMQLVSQASLTGELQLTVSDNSVIFFVHEGTLVFAHLEKNPMRIGQRLIDENYITSEDLQECLTRSQGQSKKSRIGEQLVESGYLKQADLEKTIKEQIKDIFFEVLSWKNGKFCFMIKDISTSKCIFLEERMDHLIIEGIIQLDEKRK